MFVIFLKFSNSKLHMDTSSPSMETERRGVQAVWRRWMGVDERSTVQEKEASTK